MNRTTDHSVGQASSLPVRAASLPPKCSAGKDAHRTGSQDGCATTAPFMGSEHLQKLDVSWGHEPTPNPSGGGESMSGTLAEFPSWEGSGVGRFMGRPSWF